MNIVLKYSQTNCSITKDRAKINSVTKNGYKNQTKDNHLYGARTLIISFI